MKTAPLATLLGLLLMLGGQGALSEPDSVLRDAISHESRPGVDREQDEERRPAEVLALAGIRPGMRVADLMAGAGWYTELLSHLVGPEGRVYAQNNARAHARHGFRLELRVERGIPLRWFTGPRLENVTLLENELETLEGLPEAGLDAALMVRFYHDLYGMGVDRSAMLARILASLKPGGIFVVIDHEAGLGRGASEAQRLHRVEGGQVLREVTAAGFVLDRASELLRNPDDDLASAVFDATRKGGTDRFLLLFSKPRS